MKVLKLNVRIQQCFISYCSFMILLYCKDILFNMFKHELDKFLKSNCKIMFLVKMFRLYHMNLQKDTVSKFLTQAVNKT